MDNPTDNVTPPVAQPSTTEDPKAKALGYIAQFETWLEGVMVAKAPFQIPMGGKEFLATIAPYLVIVGVVLFVLSLPVLLGMGAMVGGMGMAMGHMGWGYISLITLISGVITVGLEAFAIPGLFKRTAASWRLIFYATLVSFAGSILALNPIGAVIGGVIGWYILFQVKTLYKN